MPPATVLFTPHPLDCPHSPHPQNQSFTLNLIYEDTAQKISPNEFFIKNSQSSLTCPETQNTPSPHVRGMAVSTIDMGGALEKEEVTSTPTRQSTPWGSANITGRLIHALGFVRVKLIIFSGLSIAQPQCLGWVAKTPLDRYENTANMASLDPTLLRILDEALYVPCVIWSELRRSPSPRLVDDCCKAAIDKIQRVRLRQNESYKLESESISIAHLKEDELNRPKNYLRIMLSIEPWVTKICLSETFILTNLDPSISWSFAKMWNPPPDFTKSNRCRSENHLSRSSLLRRKAAGEQCRAKPYLWNDFRHETCLPATYHLSTHTRGSAKMWAQPPPCVRNREWFCFVSSPRRTSMDLTFKVLKTPYTHLPIYKSQQGYSHSHHQTYVRELFYAWNESVSLIIFSRTGVYHIKSMHFGSTFFWFHLSTEGCYGQRIQSMKEKNHNSRSELRFSHLTSVTGTSHLPSYHATR